MLAFDLLRMSLKSTNKIMRKLTALIAITIILVNISTAQGLLEKGKALAKAASPAGGFSKEEAAQAIKESLVNGTNSGTETVSKPDGYFKNPEIKIPFPKDAQTVEQKLRSIGAGSKVDEAVLSINRAAELAGKEAKSIFVEAIKQMTVMDAINIVKGEEDAATSYLDKTTNAILYEKFKPIIASALEKTGATKHWTTVFSTYNKIPFVKKVNSDLED
ncbi:uncharacterized protein METZ01_LOCUS465712, partial [marine metagenome]